jgi:hypothetical protein
VGPLEIEAINAERIDSWRSFSWVVRLTRWELTCGFCRLRFRRLAPFARSEIDCPQCGTRNLLPDSPKLKRS